MTSPYQQAATSRPTRRFDTERHDCAPTTSRMCDYLLGGTWNFPADQAAAERLLSVTPYAGLDAGANQVFRRRAVRVLQTGGIRQFLDLGAGLPTFGGVHDLVHARDKDARIVYVDNDPAVVAPTLHIRACADAEYFSAVHADLRSPGSVLGSETVREQLDLSQPLGLLLTAAGQFVPEHHDLAGILGAYRSMLAPGSCVVISHATAADLTCEQALGAAAVYARTHTPLTMRTPEQITALFAGFTLLPPADDARPAMVPVGEWRWTDDLKAPDDRARGLYGGVGYLP